MKKAICILLLLACSMLTANQAPIEIKIYQSDSGRDLLPTVHEWAILHYRDFPFLYAYQGEKIPHNIFLDDPNGFILSAERTEEKLGLLLALPLNSSFLDIQYSPFEKIHEIEEKGFDPDNILYIASFLIDKLERHNKVLIADMYNQAVTLAKKMGKNQICYFTPIYTDDHPLKPTPFVPPEPWDDLPFQFKPMDITLNFTWPTLQPDGTVRDSVNPQALFYQNI